MARAAWYRDPVTGLPESVDVDQGSLRAARELGCDVSRKIKGALLVLVALAVVAPLSANSYAQERIRFFQLKAVTPGETSSISGECDGNTATPEVTCRIKQVMVRLQLDPKNVGAETEKRLRQIRAEFAKNPKSPLGAICDNLAKDREEIERKLRDIKNEQAKKDVKSLMTLCAKPTLPALEAWVREATLLESRTCKISTFENDPVTFKRVGPNKWVANVGPQGLCNSVYLYTLENDPKYTNLWKWSQVRTYADTSGEFCKDMQLNYKLEYSWEGYDPDLTCARISFGM